MNAMEVMARLILALELASEQKVIKSLHHYWKRIISVMHVDKIAQIDRDTKTIQLITSLGSQTQRDEKGAAERQTTCKCYLSP